MSPTRKKLAGGHHSVGARAGKSYRAIRLAGHGDFPYP